MEGKSIGKKPPDRRFAKIGFDEGRTIREVTPLTLSMSPKATITVHHADLVSQDAVDRHFYSNTMGFPVSMPRSNILMENGL